MSIKNHKDFVSGLLSGMDGIGFASSGSNPPSEGVRTKLASIGCLCVDHAISLGGFLK